MSMIMELDTTIRSEVDNLSNKVIVVSNQADRDTISEMVKGARYIRSRVETFFKSMKENAYKTWKGIVAMEKSYTDKCDEFESAANKAILAYDRKVAAERERLEAIARQKKEAEEKAKRDAEAAQALAEDAEDDSSVEARKGVITEAQATVQKASEETTNAINIAANMTVARQNGESVRKTWKARVIDTSKLPREYMIPDQKSLDALAKAKKDQLAAGQFSIPGVEFYCDESIVRKN